MESEPFPANRLVFRLADYVIESTVDCSALWDEIESIAEEHDEYLVIFEV